jgi:protein SCO1
MRNTLLFFVLVAIAIGGGLYFFSPEFKAQRLPQDTSTGEAQIGGAFTLTDQNGKQVSDSQFRGKHMLVFFGFTSCPSICPVGLATLTQVMEQLGDDASKLQPVFITVDPETDTPKRMKEFLTNFHPSIVGLTGTLEQIKAVESDYKVYAAKSEDKNMPGGYNVDHSGFVYLMGKDGKYLEHFTYDAEPKKLVNDIKEAIR